MNNPRFRFLLRLVLSGALIALLLSRLDWPAVARLIRGVYLRPLVIGSLLGVFSQILMAERTRLMLGHWRVVLSRRKACSVTWVGQFCNNFLPGGMGGDMVKFYRVSRLYPNARAATLVALLADRLMALAALIVLSTAALACGDRELLRQLVAGMASRSASDGRFPTWAAALLLVGGIVVFVGLLAWRFRRTIIEKSSTHLRSVRDALARGKRPGGSVAAAFFLAATVHSLGMISTWYFAHALDIPISLGQIFLIWPVVLVAMMMPISVNGYGLREFILLYYFDRWHLTSHLGGGAGLKETVVALSLLTVVNDLFCNLPGGLLLLGKDLPLVPAVQNPAGPAASHSP